VVEGERLVGYLSIKDITHVLALRGVGRLAEPPPARLRRVA
jgi:hypothetical protein